MILLYIQVYIHIYVQYMPLEVEVMNFMGSCNNMEAVMR